MILCTFFAMTTVQGGIRLQNSDYEERVQSSKVMELRRTFVIIHSLKKSTIGGKVHMRVISSSFFSQLVGLSASIQDDSRETKRFHV